MREVSSPISSVTLNDEESDACGSEEWCAPADTPSTGGRLIAPTLSGGIENKVVVLLVPIQNSYGSKLTRPTVFVAWNVFR